VNLSRWPVTGNGIELTEIMSYDSHFPRSYHDSIGHITLSSLLPDSQKEKILIVDDSAVVRKHFAKVLSPAFACFEAETVVEAFRLLKEQQFELVLTDVILPGLSGIELLRKIVDSYPETTVIVVSGVDRPQRALDAMRLGAFDYLIKPCDNDVLRLTVERALERRSLLLNAKQYKRDLELRNEELVRGKAQLERLQAQIVQNEKMASLGQLAAGVAHEINNPIGFVYSNLDFLDGYVGDLIRLLELYDNSELAADAAAAIAEFKRQIGYEDAVTDLRSVIADCREGAERVRDIVQNLKTFSRLDEAEFKKTDVHEGIESTIRILSRYFSGGNIRLVRDYGVLPSVDLFSKELNQVWMNLLVNAAQAVGTADGEVRIVTRSGDTHVTVAISDTGNGIDKDHLSRIFDPFFTTKPVGEGTGLGLSISFGIVERHGGHITVNSTPGCGTTFTVMLPHLVKQDPERINLPVGTASPTPYKEKEIHAI
jgi:signal transduction histidine kinase